MVAGLFLLANYGERSRTPRTVSFVIVGLLAGTATVVTGLLALGAVVRYAAGGITTGQVRAAETVAIPLTAASAAGLLYLVPAVQRAVGRLIPLRAGSPVAATAVVLALLFLGLQLGTQLSVDVLKNLQSSPPITATDLLAQDIPLLIVAFAGVGLFVRRSPSDAADRLGLVPPQPAWWWLAALVGIIVFLLIGFGIEALARVITPATEKQVTDVSNAIFRRFNNPASIIFLGVVAGIVEETLFRGAMVPRFGVILSAFLFAAVHTQYGITFASLEVFILGVGLGWMRVQAGTLPCIATHAGYDIAVGLLGLLH